MSFHFILKYVRRCTRLPHPMWGIFLAFFILGCPREEAKPPAIDMKKLKDPLLQQNKGNVSTENAQIDGYVKRRKWPVKETGTGLRYWVYHTTQEEKAKPGKRALINFTITLINGDTCYSTLKSGPESFLIEQDYVESGLHEGVQKMRVGEKAKIIIPSYLAHGLVGDLKKIPPVSTIIYDIELLELQ